MKRETIKTQESAEEFIMRQREETLLKHILRRTWKAGKDRIKSGNGIYYYHPTNILMDDDIETLKRMLIKLGEGDVLRESKETKEGKRYTKEGNVIRMIIEH